MHHDIGAHASVVRTTEFGADYWVAARPGGREGEHCRLAGDDVLLEPELGHPERVDHIFGLHVQFHRLAGGHM